MYFNLIENRFFRLRPSDIKFVEISTTVSNKRKRRGNYRFTFKGKFEDEKGEVVTYPVTVFLLPQAADFMFDNAFDVQNEALIQTGDSRKAYLKQCEQNPKRKSNVLVTDEAVIKPSTIRQIKLTICEIFWAPTKMISEGTRGTFHSPYSQNKIGNFDFAVGAPEE